DGRGTAGAPVAVISHGYWERRFARDPGVPGRTLMLNGAAVTIVGVAPPGFRGVDLGQPAVWLPLWLAGTDAFGSASSFTGRMFWLRTIGRLRPDVAPGRPELLSERVEAPGEPGSELVVTARELRTQFGADQRGANPIPVWLLGVSATAFMIACTTVGHLLLASAAERAGEFAVRFAMGARTRDVVRLLVAEAAIVAALGAAVALLAALWSTRLLRVLPLPPLDGLVDARVVGLAVLAAVAAVARAVAAGRARRGTGQRRAVLLVHALRLRGAGRHRPGCGWRERRDGVRRRGVLPRVRHPAARRAHLRRGRPRGRR